MAVVRSCEAAEVTPEVMCIELVVWLADGMHPLFALTAQLVFR